MTTPFSAVRTFVLAFLILAGSLGAAVLGPAHEAAASGPCAVGSQVRYGVSNGYYYIYGRGTSSCSYAVNQALVVELYANGSLVKQGNIGNYSSTLATNSGSVWGRCGVRYQVATHHGVDRYSITTHWSSPFRLC